MTPGVLRGKNQDEDLKRFSVKRFRLKKKSFSRKYLLGIGRYSRFPYPPRNRSTFRIVSECNYTGSLTWPDQRSLKGLSRHLQCIWEVWKCLGTHVYHVILPEMINEQVSRKDRKTFVIFSTRFVVIDVEQP